MPDPSPVQPSRGRWVLASVVGVLVAAVAGGAIVLALDSAPGSSVPALVGFLAGGLAAGVVVGARTVDRWARAFIAVFVAGVLSAIVVGALILGTS